ncbi:MAG: multifunctional CCA addition/repair protein [Pseudomonadales bacterium]|nr:multifunctional CCA addition/repair protein [Pseudomonadales bacterium]
MEIYLVGGAVRDRLLGLGRADHDWVVVGATAAEMLAQGYTQVGRDFPVFLHPKTREEYALARTERKTAPGHTGFLIHADPTVTLEEDLQRRDLTINAIAEDSNGKLIDPYGGAQDIANRVLRHVSPAFVEDPLRVLRVARFAARFANLGFSIAPETLGLMQEIAASGELTHLPAERLWQECQKALQETSPATFIRTLRQANALPALLPEVDALFGIPQPAQHHPEIDTGLHTLMVLEQATRLSTDPVVRFAALMHDVGKATTEKDNWPHHYGHEHLGLPLIEAAAKRLRLPKDYLALARHTAAYHLQCHQALQLKASTLLNLLESLDAFRRPHQLQQFLLACEADARGREGYADQPYPQAAYVNKLFQLANALDIGALLRTSGIGQSASADKTAIKTFVHQQRLQAIKPTVQTTRTTKAARHET